MQWKRAEASRLLPVFFRPAILVISGRKRWHQRLAAYYYTPFGTQRSGGFDYVGNSLQFAGRQYDSETGLLYFRARYYDPQFGRFVSEDPIGLNGGVNPYVYASNDPINGSDPFGLTDCAKDAGTCIDGVR